MTLARAVRLTPLLCLAASLAGSAQPPQAAKPAPAHRMVGADEVVWASGPTALPTGSKMAVLSGDPSQPGPFTLRAQMPAGYRIPPHWHTTEENLTVLSGTLAMGMGETFAESALHELKAGGFVHMPATTRHFLLAKTATVIQVHGVGPFAVTYVNPADDPRNAASKN